MLHMPAYEVGLIYIAVSEVVSYTLALLAHAVYLLGYAMGIVADKAVGSIHYHLCAAVVLFQFEKLGIGVLCLECQDIINVGSAEAVDALCIISHHTHAIVTADKHAHNLVLGVIGVLVFVYQQVAETGGIFLGHLRMLRKKHPCVRQYVIKIHGLGSQQSTVVGRVDVDHTRNHGTVVLIPEGAVGRIICRLHQRILGSADAATHQRRPVSLLVEPHLLDERAHKVLAVGCIIDGEVGAIADSGALHPQDTTEDAVEGAHPQLGGPLMTHLQGYALLHLAGSLVGKRERHDLPGLISLLHQPGNLVGEHAGLPATRTCYHQHGGIAEENSPALAVV